MARALTGVCNFHRDKFVHFVTFWLVCVKPFVNIRTCGREGWEGAGRGWWEGGITRESTPNIPSGKIFTPTKRGERVSLGSATVVDFKHPYGCHLRPTFVVRRGDAYRSERWWTGGSGGWVMYWAQCRHAPLVSQWCIRKVNKTESESG